MNLSFIAGGVVLLGVGAASFNAVSILESQKNESTTSASAPSRVKVSTSVSDQSHVDSSKTPTKKKPNGEWDIPCLEANIDSRIDASAMKFFHDQAMDQCYWEFHKAEIIAGGCPAIADLPVKSAAAVSATEKACNKKRQEFANKGGV